jgi:hypothetical protein
MKKTGKPFDFAEFSLFARERQSPKIDLIAFSFLLRIGKPRNAGISSPRFNARAQRVMAAHDVASSMQNGLRY